MITPEQARGAHAAARTAFADNPTPENQKRLMTAASAVAEAEAQAATQAAEAHAAQSRQLDALRATDAERVALIERNIAELVGIERRAYALLQGIVSAAEARARDYHALKTQSLALDATAVVRPPPPAATARHTLQTAIARAQNVEGRFGADNCICSAWVQPAEHIFDKPVIRRFA